MLIFYDLLHILSYLVSLHKKEARSVDPFKAAVVPHFHISVLVHNFNFKLKI